MENSHITISSVEITEEEENLVLEVLRSGHIAQGPKVEHLEALFAAACDTGHAIAVSSGTAALFLSLEALDLQPGDEVITSPFTFIATLNAIIAAGATARFADIGADYNLDPESVSELINERTRAILPVHLYGCPADLPALHRLATDHGLLIIEDAAQAVGASVNGQSVGSWGVGCFSLYATKNVTTAEGGIVTTNDSVLADRLRLLRNQGMRNRYEYDARGFNMRLTDLQAAIGIPQMSRLKEITARRRHNAARLTSGLGDASGLLLPFEPPGRHHVFHQYTVATIEPARIGREELAERLFSRGVGTGIYYPNLVNSHAPFQDHDLVIHDPTPRAADAAASVLSLPVHPRLEESDLDQIITAVRESLDA